MTLGNYTQFNMLGMGSGMGYQNFLGSGFGMGGFGMGSIFGGCNMFQRCDGTVNYNAMAGMAVGGILTNCLFGFLGQVISNRQAKKAEAPEANIESVKNDLDAKKQEKSNLESTLASKKGEKAGIDANLDTAKSKLNALPSKVSCEQAIAEFKAAKSTDPNYTELKDKAEQAEKDLAERTKLEAEIKKLENDQKKLQEEIDSLENTKIPNIVSEIKELETKYKEMESEIQQAQDKKLFDKADGTIFNKRTSEKDLYSKTYDKNTATEADLKGAIYQLGQAQKTGNQDTIKKAASKAKEVYEALPDNLKKQNADLITAIKRYI